MRRLRPQASLRWPQASLRTPQVLSHTLIRQVLSQTLTLTLLSWSISWLIHRPVRRHRPRRHRPLSQAHHRALSLALHRPKRRHRPRRHQPLSLAHHRPVRRHQTAHASTCAGDRLPTIPPTSSGGPIHCWPVRHRQAVSHHRRSPQRSRLVHLRPARRRLPVSHHRRLRLPGARVETRRHHLSHHRRSLTFGRSWTTPLLRQCSLAHLCGTALAQGTKCPATRNTIFSSTV